MPPAYVKEQAHLNLIIHGETAAEGAFTLTKGPLPVPITAPPVAEPAPVVAHNDGDVVARAGIKLLKINVGLAILGVLGYGGFWLTRRLKKGKPWKKP
ncbi:hypothetical protein [Steroidobacter sp.]|uniref:hypothetical protein n=1 Tax=Steroidobacter sp. TaxID=1978227 RepID=UPI001A460A90|nr:hypothetical protein [Steroidobacter sp.]MBL8266616.1 hypothetical protein [Steroidobacter sp.]